MRLLVLLSALLAPLALRGAGITIDIGSAVAMDWRAEGVELSLTPVDGGWRLELAVARWLASGGPRLSLTASCAKVDPGAARVVCEDTQVVLGTDAKGTPRLTGAAIVELLADGFRLSMSQASFAGAPGKLAVTRRGERTTLTAAFDGIEAAALAAALPAGEAVGLPEVSAGTVGLALSLERDDRRWLAVDVRLDLQGLAFASADGLRAGEGLALAARLTLEPGGANALAGSVEVTGGGIYLHPTFIDLGATPLQLSLAGRRDTGSGGVDVHHLRVAQVGVLEATGSARLSAELAPRSMRLDVERTPLAPLVEHWLRPFAPEELSGELAAVGDFAAGLTWEGDDRVGARLDLYDGALGDQSGRFSVQGLDGRLQWHSHEPRAITLAMESAQVYRLTFGAARFIGEVTGDRFSLLQPLRLPLLDGALRVDSLEMRRLAAPGFGFTLSGELEPMPLPELSAALGWPQFSGTLSGTLPELRYADGVLTLGSPLTTRVFDGEVVVDDLQLENPLGVSPVLRADVRVNDISLEALTRVFAFGRMTGRLEGEVKDLVLGGWHPLAFDARLRTPAGDDSERRISQRAVENLASIGGAGGAISAGFLRIFSEFSYDRLGISCRLRAGMCEMGGIAPAESGYYIVVGAGLPRIDVVGYNERVDWSQLVQQVIQATRSEGPVVR